MERKYIISIDMGGTKILGSIINSKEGIVARYKRSTKVQKTKVKKVDFAETLFTIVSELIFSSKIPESQIKAICLGIPGSVNPHTGKIGIAPNLNIKNYNIKEKLQKYTQIPVLIENDVNLASLGIQNFGYGIDKKNMLVVFVGTGIGGGLIFNSKLYRGSTYFAGEIGHIEIMKNGPLCGCGKRGCFEALASRTAIVKNIVSDVKLGKKSVISKLVKENIPIKSKALLNAINSEDKLVSRHIAEACETIGLVLANLNNLLNLEIIVLGGGVIEALHAFMIPKIRLAFKNHSLVSSAKGVRVVATKLGDDAALYGGIALAEEFLGIKV
jgi:glucokinase